MSAPHTDKSSRNASLGGITSPETQPSLAVRPATHTHNHSHNHSHSHSHSERVPSEHRYERETATPFNLPARHREMERAPSVATNAIEDLTRCFMKLPGIGPKSARRAVHDLICNKESMMTPLIKQLQQAQDDLVTCSICGNIDVITPCGICSAFEREKETLCVVEKVTDLWAIERSREYRGLYHVLGGVLSTLNGVSPEDLNITSLLNRVSQSNHWNASHPSHTNVPTAEFLPQGCSQEVPSHPAIKEIILATNATLEGQITARYLYDKLSPLQVKVTALARGIPAGGELDYLDNHTLASAFATRRNITE